jgi:hypothetical protein
MHRRTRPKSIRKPELSVPPILIRADAFHVRYGFWPKEGALPQTIGGALNEKWRNVDDALRPWVSSRISRFLRFYVWKGHLRPARGVDLGQ